MNLSQLTFLIPHLRSGANSGSHYTILLQVLILLQIGLLIC